MGCEIRRAGGKRGYVQSAVGETPLAWMGFQLTHMYEAEYGTKVGLFLYEVYYLTNPSMIALKFLPQLFCTEKILVPFSSIAPAITLFGTTIMEALHCGSAPQYLYININLI